MEWNGICSTSYGCILYFLLILLQKKPRSSNLTDADVDLDTLALKDTAYRRWNCHSGMANPVQIVSTHPAPSNGVPITILWQAGHADPLDGWKCSS